MLTGDVKMRIIEECGIRVCGEIYLENLFIHEFDGSHIGDSIANLN